MSETVRARLLRHLEHLTSEELEKFKLVYLVDHIPRGRLEGANHVQVADLLVISLGEQEAWELALSIWEKMGQMELCERARKDKLIWSNKIMTEKRKPKGKMSRFLAFVDKLNKMLSDQFHIHEENEDFESLQVPVLSNSTDERNKYQERMKKKFQLMKDRNSRPGEHELFHHRFTELLLLQEFHYKEQKHQLIIHRRKHTKDTLEQEPFTDLSGLFDPDRKTGIQPHTVVLQGAAGIGKSTLVIKVMLDWAEGKLYEKMFNYIFYLTCRELNSLRDKVISLADFIANEWPGPQAPIAEIMSQPEKLLFIIDGLDELKFPCNEHRYDLCKDWKEQKPVPILLSSLLRKTLLPEAYLLLTTKLTALGKFSPLLENASHVEILGFSVEHRKEYFCKFFRDENLGKEAFNLVEGNATLFTMCSIPLMNWIVCTCMKQQEERGRGLIQALKTTTSLYMSYLSNLIICDDKKFISQHLRGLCHLAAEGIWGKKLLFEEEDLRRHDLEAADVSAFLDMSIFQKDGDCENCYSFIHLSFQEFFAALFYVMSTDKEGVKNPDSSIPDVKILLEQYSGNDANFVVLVVRFLFGFLNAETARELERKFGCSMSPEIKSQLLLWIKGETKSHKKSQFSNSNLPEWYSYLYETQDAEFVTQALVNIKEFKIKVYQQSDALSALFCIKHCPGVQRIFFSYPCGVPAYVWQDFFSAVNSNHYLKELKLSWIEFDNSSIENLCVKLRNPNCTLEKLTLEGLKITDLDCQCLFSALNMKSLYLHGISFVEGDLNLPYETLKKENCQLQTLRITHSQRLGGYVKNFFSIENLQNLDMSFTWLEEREIEVLCKVFTKHDCKLQALSLEFCVLSSICFQNLFHALNFNKSLKNLDISQNFIKEAELKHLCKVLENSNCKLEKLRLANCKLTIACLKNLLPAICSSETLKFLDLRHNFFGDEGMNMLCKTLEKQNYKLQTLRLWEFDISKESERALTSLNSRISCHITWEQYEDINTKFFDWDAEDIL
ncbi:NACHT, LRR and PYD domains-containing protein 12-like isoform X2 [Macrotis lagotis]|uniref:NACHT, LRR and PYD domains-containing protein 12-like isoform X2 n=1 Tax=Macrotis lagotis TaxID=92651 RepID=UPI003D686CBE